MSKVKGPDEKPRANPSFAHVDLTPAERITGIITERGVFKPGELAIRFQS